MKVEDRVGGRDEDRSSARAFVSQIAFSRSPSTVMHDDRTMPPLKPTVARKRNRKRKRRAVSSSSDEDDSSSDSDVQKDRTPPALVRVPTKAPSSDGEDTSSEDDESSEDDASLRQPVHQNTQTFAPSRRSPSPDVRPCPIPPFSTVVEDEEQLRQRFRKFWMASVADAFSDDLGEIRRVRERQPFLAVFL